MFYGCLVVIQLHIFIRCMMVCICISWSYRQRSAYPAMHGGNRLPGHCQALSAQSPSVCHKLPPRNVPAIPLTEYPRWYGPEYFRLCVRLYISKTMLFQMFPQLFFHLIRRLVRNQIKSDPRVCFVRHDSSGSIVKPHRLPDRRLTWMAPYRSAFQFQPTASPQE